MPLWLPLPGWWGPNGAGDARGAHHEAGDPLHPPVRLRLGWLPQPHQVHLYSQVPGGNTFLKHYQAHFGKFCNSAIPSKNWQPFGESIGVS